MDYHFSKRQGQAIAQLWPADDEPFPTLHESTIAEVLDPGAEEKQDHFRLRDLFKIKKPKNGRNRTAMHPAWGKMIVRVSKGTYGLAEEKGESPT